MREGILTTSAARAFSLDEIGTAVAQAEATGSRGRSSSYPRMTRDCRATMREKKRNRPMFLKPEKMSQKEHIYGTPNARNCTDPLH